MKVDREGVGETHPTGEMTKSTYLDESKTTKDDKTRYSFEEGEKIPSDLGEYRTACLEERKVDSDGMKMTRADTTGEERNLSKTAGNVEKGEAKAGHDESRHSGPRVNEAQHEEQESLLEKQCPKKAPTHTSDKRRPWDTEENVEWPAGGYRTRQRGVQTGGAP